MLYRLKEYMKKKENNKLVINQTQQKYAKSLQRVRPYSSIRNTGSLNILKRWTA
jgi:hypothetical protein